jgi:hypothetical protein
VSENTLVASLARAQAKFGPIAKGHENAHFKSTYADIADVLAVVRPVLAAEGIAFVQPVRISADGCELVTALLKGDERMESVFPMPDNLAPQATLSWLTYMRRGMACSMLGVHPAGEDDDGNAAQAASSEPAHHGSRFPGARAATAKQIGLAAKLLREVVHQNQALAFTEETVGRAAPVDELSAIEVSKLIDALYDAKKAGRTPEGAVPATEEPF